MTKEWYDKVSICGLAMSIVLLRLCQLKKSNFLFDWTLIIYRKYKVLLDRRVFEFIYNFAFVKGIKYEWIFIYSIRYKYKNSKVNYFALPLYYYRPNLKSRRLDNLLGSLNFLDTSYLLEPVLLLNTISEFFLRFLSHLQISWGPWSDLNFFNWFKFKYLIIIFWSKSFPF